MRVVTAVAIVLLAGCAGGEGFRPLHGTTASNPGVQARMAAIDVAPIPSRVGQRIRNELIFQNTGGGDPVKPQYRLVLTLRESLGSTLVKNSGEALSQIYTLDAQFKLYRLTDNKVIVEGSSHGRAGFERFQQIYANVRAREDAENRAARSVADDIKTRLAAMLSSSQI
jgi:LPS-assembly lipoprotein